MDWLSVTFFLLAVPVENILLGLPLHLPRHDIPDVAGACPFSGLHPGVGVGRLRVRRSFSLWRHRSVFSSGNVCPLLLRGSVCFVCRGGVGKSLPLGGPLPCTSECLCRAAFLPPVPLASGLAPAGAILPSPGLSDGSTTRRLSAVSSSEMTPNSLCRAPRHAPWMCSSRPPRHSVFTAVPWDSCPRGILDFCSPVADPVGSCHLPGVSTVSIVPSADRLVGRKLTMVIIEAEP